MFERRFITIIALVTALILVGGIWLVGSGNTPKTSAQYSFEKGGKVGVGQNYLDWGEIGYSGGNKEAFFKIRNEGDSVLKLRNVKTSCHCTKAEVKINDQISPSFGMGGISSWLGEVTPGSEAELRVIFDPAYHGPQGVGPIERYVRVETSDPDKKYLEFMVKGVVEKN